MPVPTSNTVRVLQFDEPVVEPPPRNKLAWSKKTAVTESNRFQTKKPLRITMPIDGFVEFEGEAPECFALMLASRRRAVA